MRSFARALSLVALVATTSLSAHATTIDFESQAAGRGGSFTGTVDSPLTIGTATFTGGELLNNETGTVADHTGVYATVSGFGSGYTNPLHIAFSSSVTGFNILVTNLIDGTFTVADNLGDTSSMFLTLGNSHTFSLAGNGITSVTIAETGTSGWDFAIDNVNFSPATSTTPEPSSIALLGTGILGVAGMLRKKLLTR